MRFALTGLTRFNQRTAAFLARHGSSDDSFIVFDRSTRLGKLRFLAELPRTVVIFAYWGTVNHSRALELANHLGKRVVQFWAGTDVLDAERAVKAGLLYRPLTDRCIHLCESEWTRDELAAFGIRAHVVPLAPLTSFPEASALTMPDTFSVLAYVGQAREDFYGLPKILQIARHFPTVPFRICGNDGSSLSHACPPNVTFLGWTEDIASLYDESAVFLRIPEHDGCSFSIREALAWGRYVIASYPYAHCLVAREDEVIASHLGSLKRAFDAGSLPPNRGGRDFVVTEYDEARVAEQLCPFLGMQ